MMPPTAKLDAAGYRKFGLLTGAIFAVLFGLLLPWLFDYGLPSWPWILFAVLALMALAAPMTLQPVYLAWMKFGHIMNWINTRLILGLVFYGMILPIGIFFKLVGRDPMQRKFDSQSSSYRRQAASDAHDNMEHPY